MEFPIQKKSHDVQKLTVNLPGYQNVYIKKDANIAATVKQVHAKTTLAAFFELKANDPDARKTIYQDIPTKYMFENKR